MDGSWCEQGPQSAQGSKWAPADTNIRASSNDLETGSSIKIKNKKRNFEQWMGGEN